jgi:hypothetical protein
LLLVAGAGFLVFNDFFSIAIGILPIFCFNCLTS